VRRIAVTEYERASFSDLATAAAKTMAATGAVRVYGPFPGGTTLVEARSVVGVARVGTGPDALELQIQPKIGVPRLLWLLGHARDQSGWRSDDITTGTDIGLVAAMAIMFEARCRRVLAAGLLHGYREHEETLPGLRGRLREADQMRARPGLPLPLDVRYDEYTSDIDENRLLRTAARQLLALTGVPPTARVRLTRLDRDLADATPLIPGQPAPNIAITRLNRRYAPALHLARLVLNRTSINDRQGAATASGFLFDMNRVYEDWLTQALADRLDHYGGYTRRQHPVALDARRRTIMRVDLTWWSTAGCRAVIDAKYKRLTPAGPRPEDLYQALAYCTALGTTNGHLVYAAGNPVPPAAIRRSNITVHTHVVPITQDPDQVLAAVASLAKEIIDIEASDGSRR
jgi:5-methylcytosine-specific restriction enzyme subunit McrC